MLLSKSCLYALRAAVLLAGKSGDGYVTIRKLSDELDISFHFLTKVLQQLTKDGMLESYKGPNGGVKLAKPAHTISFMDVVLSVDGDYLLKECVLGLPGCGVQKPCALHDQWSLLKGNIMAMMENTSLDKIAKDEKYLAFFQAARTEVKKFSN